jgi:hypothetical protein
MRKHPVKTTADVRLCSGGFAAALFELFAGATRARVVAADFA